MSLIVVIVIDIDSCADSRICHKKHSCQSRRGKNTREDASKITFPGAKQNGNLNKIEMGEAFHFKTPSSILIEVPLAVARLVLLNHYSWITWTNCL